MRVVLADDHALVRAGIRALLERIPGVQVVGEAGDGAEAIAIIESIQPDLALMDIAMRGRTGLEVTEEVTAKWPHVKILILSVHANEEYVIQALRRGASGYLLKDSAAEELTRALGEVMRGETYLSPSISRSVIAGYVARLSGEKPLTPRQREVLRLVAEGHSTKEIAATLELSVKTVETHRAQVMARLGIHDVAGLVKYAIRTGVIAPEP